MKTLRIVLFALLAILLVATLLRTTYTLIPIKDAYVVGVTYHGHRSSYTMPPEYPPDYLGIAIFAGWWMGLQVGIPLLWMTFEKKGRPA